MIYNAPLMSLNGSFLPSHFVAFSPSAVWTTCSAHIRNNNGIPSNSSYMESRSSTDSMFIWLKREKQSNALYISTSVVNCEKFHQLSPLRTFIALWNNNIHSTRFSESFLKNLSRVWLVKIMSENDLYCSWIELICSLLSEIKEYINMVSWTKSVKVVFFSF